MNTLKPLKWLFLRQELIDRTEDETEIQFLAQCVSHNRRTIGHTKKDYEKLDSF